MWIPKEIGRIATRLKDGHRVNRITVRDLLRMFKAERRGLNKVHEIRTALDSLGLMTDPDFESVWIDGRVRIRLKSSTGGLIPEPSLAVEEEAVEEDELADDEELEEGQALTAEEQDEEDAPEVGVDQPQAPILAASEGIVETVLSEPELVNDFETPGGVN
jgi:hypothetical protein